MPAKDWKWLLQNSEDTIIFEGRVYSLVAKHLGQGIYEVSKQIKPLKNNVTAVSSLSSVSHQYSGDESTSFWDIINSIENVADQQELYSLGVALQKMENYVLRRLRCIKESYVQ